MNGLETALVIAVFVMTILWIATLGAIIFIVWRLRKVILAVSFAFRGIAELGRQMHGLAGNVATLKRDIHDRARHTRQW